MASRKPRVTFRCPTCHQPISQELHDKITQLDAAKRERFHREQQRLERQRRELNFERKAIKTERSRAVAQSKAALAKQKHSFQLSLRDERKRHREALEKQKEALRKKAEQQVKDALARAEVTQQQRGRAQEPVLAEMLKQVCRNDKILTFGTKGDVAQFVKVGTEPYPVIIYESKRKERIGPQDVRDALKAKRKQKNVHFVVLVHTGTRMGRKSFSGFCFERGVVIVSLNGAPYVAVLLRKWLEQRADFLQRLSDPQREAVIQEMLRFLDGPDFHVPLDQIIQDAVDDNRQIIQERHQIESWWKKRGERFERTVNAATYIGDTIANIQGGKTIDPYCVKNKIRQLSAAKQQRAPEVRRLAASR